MKLDLIAIGRSSVDLYGSQIGGRLEDMGSFEKYIGGSPTNIATGCARLGLRSGLITRVGDEHMGRFIRQQLVAEGVDVRGVTTDPERLSALVLLGIRDNARFPLIFYRENCADMALCEDDIDSDFISQARCVVATGTHLSHPDVAGATLKAVRLAREHGARTVLDIDFRPNLWGLSAHGDGENRFVASDEVTARLRSTLDLFDLIVGTEEEFHISGGTTDTIAALSAVRTRTRAVLVCKRGPMGAVVFDGAIPSDLTGGITGEGFDVEVFNVLGAGDGFMAGLLKGWLGGEDWHTSLKYANACGALAVSRHGCTPSYPSRRELDYFLKTGIRNRALRNDEALEAIHWSTNRKGKWPDLRIFAFDHREQFEEMATNAGVQRGHIARFKQLCLMAALEVADDRPGYGIICDGRFGRETLFRATGTGLWIGRPVELPGSRPLELEPRIGPDCGGLRDWPRDQTVKVLCQYHPDDDDALKWRQEAELLRVFAAARRNKLELMLEVIVSNSGVLGERTVANVLDRFYDIGIIPDWWKLEPLTSQRQWRQICATVAKNDPYCRGIVVLGFGATLSQLRKGLKTAARNELVRGFAIGRSIFNDVAT
ncbi:MAG: 5-dehydro-2-deoxygluconokinase, partial [Paracoccaceae bacterium]